MSKKSSHAGLALRWSLICVLLTIPTLVLAAPATVTWTTPSGSVTEYRLERRPEPCSGAGTWSQIATIPAPTLSYADTLPDGQTYSYRVRAANGAAVGPYSGCGQIVVPAVAPGAPGTPVIQLGTAPAPSTLQVGMYYLPASRMADWKAKGGTLAHEWCSADGSRIGYLDQAHALGLKVLLEIAYKGGGPTSYQGVRDCIRPYKNHPATYGYGGVDEADLRQMTPSDIQGLYQAIKAEDPNHPASIVLTCSELDVNSPYHCSKYVFPEIDVYYHDPYPCNYGEPCADYVRSWFRRSRGWIQPSSKPMGIILQGFNWMNEFGQINGQNSRYPTAVDVKQSGLNALAESGNAPVIFIYAWGGHKENPPRSFDQFMPDSWTQMLDMTTAWKAWTPSPPTFQFLPQVPIYPQRKAPMPRPIRR